MFHGRIGAKDIGPCGCSNPGTASPASCYCAVQDLLRIIRRRYSLAVMHVIYTHERAHYHDVAAALPQASSSTLAETLQALETAHLLDRNPPSEDAARPVYMLTGSGVKLLTRLRPLLDEIRGL